MAPSILDVPSARPMRTLAFLRRGGETAPAGSELPGIVVKGGVFALRRQAGDAQQRQGLQVAGMAQAIRRDIGGQVLVDGGTVNPLPLNRVRREPGDVLVAVDVSAPFSEEMAVRNKASLNYYKVITASSEIMQQHIARLMCKLYKPDLLIEMPADRFGIFEFYRAREIVEAGRMATRAALERSLVEAG